MRVLMQSRPDLFAIPAGDTVQILETKAWLEQLGVRVGFSTDAAVDLEGYDLVHLFNLTRVGETAAQCENALMQGKQVLVSTIYWNPEEYITHESPRQKIWLLSRWREDNAVRAKVAASASMLLPNALGEMRLIEKDLGVRGPFRVVPNGADPAFAQSSSDQFVQRHGICDFVLCCGRISPRKNQLTVVRATCGLDMPVVFIGPVNDPFYLDACRREAGLHHYFLGPMSHAELASAYTAARVHALASWFETPGLASLEAAMAGCNIVSTDRGTAREYFGDLAWYCDPGDTDSVRSAIVEAYERPRSPAPAGGALAGLVKERFTWEHAARATLEAYRSALAGSSSC